MKIPDDIKIQSASLRVKDLSDSLSFYSELLGLKELKREGNHSYLSANGNYPALVELHEDMNAQPIDRHTTGLYHIAFRFSSRKTLAEVFMNLFKHNVKFHGFSDHLVSEAIYLPDPDGNGIELYVDKPKDEWEWNDGQIKMDTLPLNLNLITRELGEEPYEWKGISSDTVIGHMHLRVSDLIKAEDFYKNILGFDITTREYPGALFFSAGGYHHHIGTNTWSVNKIRNINSNHAGLISFTIQTPSLEYLNHICEIASANGMKTESLANNDSSQGFYLSDFDNNKIKLTL